MKKWLSVMVRIEKILFDFGYLYFFYNLNAC